ncbi:tRNA pseudouridine(38-40) synthase TruA [Ilumatobacter fluminis]|uniref:tRNA pseudouridine(38-40) synthase TruA n=1 Tax=Ilumatobacter fluminis TaxID=467091 RepID=UPI00106113AC
MSEGEPGRTVDGVDTADVVLRRCRFTVAYHGAKFRGFAPNHGVRTVMGDLMAAMTRVLRRPVELTGAGRTDAGVHAWGQVVTGDLPADTDLHRFARRINKLCAPDVSIRDGDWTEPDFDARFSATWRQYRYHVWNDPAPNPILADVAWHVGRPLDLDAMQRAAADFLGEHDFSSFCRKPKVDADHPLPSMVRIMHEVGWTRVDDTPMLRFEIKGSAFCHQQVRSTVGTLVDIGLGRLGAASIPDIIAACDRDAAGGVAPPHGLVLWAVGYDGRRWDA